MKTTKVISMAEFAKEVEKIAVNLKRPYYTVDVSVGKHLRDSSNIDSIKFSAYIDGYGHHSGKTPNECLQLLKAHVYPTKQIIKEVLV